MQIIRLAEGRLVKIQITIDYSNGTMKARPVDTQEKKGCANGMNAKLLQELLMADLPEYGSVEITDSGLTEEGFEQKEEARSPTKPFMANPLVNPDAPAPNKPGGKFTPQKPVEQGKLDTGFGV